MVDIIHKCVNKVKVIHLKSQLSFCRNIHTIYEIHIEIKRIHNRLNNFEKEEKSWSTNTILFQDLYCNCNRRQHSIHMKLDPWNRRVNPYINSHIWAT